MFSLLIAFFHAVNFLYPHCFFAAFLSGTSSCVVVLRVLQIWESFFYPQAFFTLHSSRHLHSNASARDLREVILPSDISYLTLLPHICHSTASATDFRGLFVALGIFYLTLFPDIWHNSVFHQPAFKGSLAASSSSLKL